MQQKVVLVTGASAGIGYETAMLLQQQGYIVYGAARRVDKMEGLVKAGARALAMDVTDEQSVRSGISTILKETGRIDVLINNAGFGSYGAVEDVPLQDARYQMDVNVFGASRLIQLVLPAMRKQHYGKIVNVTSIGGKMATPLGGWYHASKFALEALSDSLRYEVREFGIDVILIEPGGIKTEWLDITRSNLYKISGETAYKGLVKRTGQMFNQANDKSSEPMVIAELIKKAIEAAKPKARYVAGYLAKPILFMKRWLSDAAFDRMITSRLK